MPSPVRGAGSETTAPERAPAALDGGGLPDVAPLELGGAPPVGAADAAGDADAEDAAAGVALGAGPVNTGVAAVAAGAGVAATGAA